MQTRTYQKQHTDIVDIADRTGSSPTAAGRATATATCGGCG